MATRSLKLEVTPAARDWLAKAGYDPDYGARPLRRVLQRSVEDQLALAMLEGRYTEGSVVTVDVAGPSGSALSDSGISGSGQGPESDSESAPGAAAPGLVLR